MLRTDGGSGYIRAVIPFHIYGCCGLQTIEEPAAFLFFYLLYLMLLFYYSCSLPFGLICRKSFWQAISHVYSVSERAIDTYEDIFGLLGLFEASERNLPLILHFLQQGLKEIEG